MAEIFISHASEDKEAVARPLAVALTQRGINVWFDESTLCIGDSLRREIDRGLAACRYGVVVLSPSFFAKEWPQRELDGLVSREAAESEKRILPVWHNVAAKDVARFSPTLADRLGVSTSHGLDAVVKAILQVLQPRGMVQQESTSPPNPPLRGGLLENAGVAELEEALDLANDYLLPNPLSFCEAVAAVIRKSFGEAGIRQPPRGVTRYLRSGNAAHRVVGYLVCQVAAEMGGDLAAYALELTACLGRERVEASERKETRPLWQLLVTMGYVLQSEELGRERVHVRHALHDMLHFLRDDSTLDPGGECKALIERLIQLQGISVHN